jgi:hypothetical protein
MNRLQGRLRETLTKSYYRSIHTYLDLQIIKDSFVVPNVELLTRKSIEAELKLLPTVMYNKI